jgi:DNA-binding CsgD family transcriptional regulator
VPDSDLSVPPIARHAFPWPLVGRDEELARIERARATGSGCPGVVITAGAGVGKSGLAREALAVAGRSGAIVRWVQATRSAAGVPLGAFAEMLPAETRSSDLLELMRGSASLMREQAAGKRIVLTVDDAQLLDPVSAALVLHLAASGTVFAIVTARAGEPCPDAIVSLWKDAGAMRLELDPLDERETATLIEHALAGPVEEDLRQWVFSSSQGNPLYIRELLRGALDHGSLLRVRGYWRLSEHPPPSESLTDLVAQRLSGLERSELRALELLALGEPLPLPVIVELAGADPLARAETHRLVVVDPPSAGGAVRLAHPMYGEVLRESLPASWARELRVLLADSFRARGDLGAHDSLRVARWLLDAGEPLEHELLVSAARSALQSSDTELAAELSALAFDARGSFDAALVLARAHTRRKRFAEAELVLAAVEGSIETQEQAVEYLEPQITTLYWGLRRYDELRGLLARVEPWWDDHAWELRLEPLRLYVDLAGGETVRGVERTTQALADPELDGPTRRQLEALHAVGLFYAGRTEEAWQLASRLRPSVPFSRQSDELMLGLYGTLAIATGRAYQEVEVFMVDALRQAVRVHDHAAAGLAALTLGNLCSVEARFVEASQWLSESELHLELQDGFGALVTTRALQAVVATAMADPQRVQAALQRMRDALGGHEPMPNQLAHVLRAEAWAAWLAGDAPAAQRILLGGADRLAAMPASAARLAYEAMRAGAGAELVSPLLDGLAARCDAPSIDACAAHARARRAHDPEGMQAAGRQFEEIGANRFAVEAFGHAAAQFAALGDRDAARRAAAHARELHERGRGASIPVIEGLETDKVTLTPREEQLVGLARNGLSNADIADRLVLSVRTVESHMYRAMQKLGARDRREL